MPIDPPDSPWHFDAPTDAGQTEGADVVGLGADLEPGTLLNAYRSGIFPMRLDFEDEQMAWWSPEERGVLRLSGLLVSRSLRASCRRYEVRVDTAFADVVAACASPDREGAWIDEEIATAYRRLHELGWAHSIETWSSSGDLVGGLYGVAIGGLFAGESMFSHARDASKVALVGLVSVLDDEHASERLIDTQWQTDHLATLGVEEIPRSSYLAKLPDLLEVPLPAVWL